MEASGGGKVFAYIQNNLFSQKLQIFRNRCACFMSKVYG
jgi:hypothetical protein